MRTPDFPSPVPLTEGRVWGGIWTLSWPMLLIMLCNFAVGFTDVYVAGRIGPDVQAAVGFVAQLYFLMIILANAVSVGTVALVSRSIGAGDPETARLQARQAILFGLAVAGVLSLAGVLFYRSIVALAGFPPEIRSMGETFLRIFVLALGPNYLLIVTNAVFRASGEVRKPLMTMFAVALLNVWGDFGLVFGVSPFPALGYPGIAVATAGSTAVGMAINLVFLYTSHWRGVYRRPWRFTMRVIRPMLAVAWPSAGLQIAWNAGSIVLYNILGRLGAASVAALASLTNGYRIEAVIFLPAFALHMSASVLVGQNLGAGRPHRAARVGWEIAWVGAVLMSLEALAVYLAAGPLARILTEDPLVVRETVRYLRVNMVSEPFLALSMILGGALQGAGDSRGAMWVIVTGMWLIRLPLAYVLGIVLGYGAPGVWIAMVVSMAVQGVLMALRFKGGRWKGMRLEGPELLDTTKESCSHLKRF